MNRRLLIMLCVVAIAAGVGLAKVVKSSTSTSTPAASSGIHVGMDSKDVVKIAGMPARVDVGRLVETHPGTFEPSDETLVYPSGRSLVFHDDVLVEIRG